MSHAARVPSNDGPHQPLHLIRCHYCQERITLPEAGQLVSVAPGDRHWIAAHDACLEQHVPQPGLLAAVVYWIGLDDLSTREGLAYWDRHLSDKNWVSSTDWPLWHRALLEGVQS